MELLSWIPGVLTSKLVDITSFPAWAQPGAKSLPLQTQGPAHVHSGLLPQPELSRPTLATAQNRLTEGPKEEIPYASPSHPPWLCMAEEGGSSLHTTTTSTLSICHFQGERGEMIFWGIPMG